MYGGITRKGLWLFVLQKLEEFLGADNPLSVLDLYNDGFWVHDRDGVDADIVGRLVWRIVDGIWKAGGVL